MTAAHPFGARPLYLLAEPRSGSSWLMNTLNSHAEIAMEGERLNPNCFPEARQFIRIPFSAYPACLNFLEKGTHPENASWTGCKLLLPHLEQVGKDFPSALTDRVACRGGRFLFLTRRDLLAARISQDLAKVSGRWHVYRKEPLVGKTLTGDPRIIWTRMDHSWNQRERIRRALDSRTVPVLDLVYEELFHRPRFWLRRIALFLNVPFRGFRRDKEIRGNPRSPRQVLSNYSQVAEQLRADPRFEPLVRETAREEA